MFLGSATMDGIRSAGLWLVWLISGTGAGLWWQSLRAAMIHWDGQIWLLKDARGEIAGEVSVRLDLQTFILLRLQPVDSKQQAPRWTWAEARNDFRRWGDLRRALYAPRRLDAVDTAVQTGSAHD